ncbi:hypothetical protein CONPUDRAFT_161960, partial [Coniophora puteana RWD-64-598 SS2]
MSTAHARAELPAGFQAHQAHPVRVKERVQLRWYSLRRRRCSRCLHPSCIMQPCSPSRRHPLRAYSTTSKLLCQHRVALHLPRCVQLGRHYMASFLDSAQPGAAPVWSFRYCRSIPALHLYMLLSDYVACSSWWLQCHCTFTSRVLWNS